MPNAQGKRVRRVIAACMDCAIAGCMGEQRTSALPHITMRGN